MAIGCLVTVPDLQADGLARLMADRGGFKVIRFLATGAEMTQEDRLVLRYALMPGTRVTARIGDADIRGAITARPPAKDAATGLLVYGLAADGGEQPVREDAITALAPVDDALERLATVQFNDLRPPVVKGSVRPSSQVGPEPWAAQTAGAREALLAWRDAAWAGTGGVVGLAAARVVPLPHQLLVARRCLADRQVRFLLADEVGLGKTIEAGLVIQSLLAIKPDLRVLVITPGALMSQWFLELHVRFGGRPWLMVDRERLRTLPGNPWADRPFVIASALAVEELEGKEAMRLATSQWDVVVVDECHRMQPGGALWQRVAVLSRRAPHVLLLSATPARQHADAYLALLALLQPAAWSLKDLPAFKARLAAQAPIADLLARTAAGTEPPAALAAAWTALLPDDPAVARLAAGLAADPKPLLDHVRELHQLDRRLIRNRRQVLRRLAAASGVQDFPPTSRSHERIPAKPDAAERAVRAAHAAYRTALVGAVPAPVPPRLAHWLIQVEQAVAAHPVVLERMLALRDAVRADPAAAGDYRRRAKAGEGRAQVLRADLSESEVNTHIAISAACHADLEAEAAPLAALRDAAAAWRKAAGKGTARLRTLVARLEAFWTDHPQEKVLVFTSHALAIEPLAEHLRKAFGAGAVETFGAHQDTLEREASARRFADDDRCPLLVCDPLGGEGRNFQFVSVVVHHDLPWSLAAVEQRIGRVDRLGRDGDIPSWVLVPDDADAVDGAWAEVLDGAVGVFTASSSGLEFISDAVESQALDAALAGGGAALRAAIPALKALVDGERTARDRAEDEGFHADAAAYAAAGRIAAAVAAQEAPAGAVARWVRGLGGDAKRDEERRCWKLRERTGQEPVEGVFDRDAALRTPSLAFLGIGHDLIDRLVADAAGARWAAACAWRRPGPEGAPRWTGVRAVAVLLPDLAPIAAAGLRLDVLRRLFLAAPPVRRLICAGGSPAVVVEDPDLIARLTPAFSAKAGDIALSAAVNRDAWTKPWLGGQPAKVTGWQDGVRAAGAAVRAGLDRDVAADRARWRAALDPVLEHGAAAAAAIAATAAARLGADHPEAVQAAAEAADESRQAAALRAAVDGARWELDGAAFVMVG